MSVKKIFVTGNNTLIREALRNLIKEEANLICIGEASSGLGLLNQIISPPDMVLLDLDIPYPTTPLDIINELKSRYPSLKIATLSHNLNKSLLIHRYSLFRLEGSIFKNDPCSEIKEVIINIAFGHQDCSSQIMRHILEATLSQAPQLSKREAEVFLLAKENDQEIAKRLNICLSTVKTHIWKIKLKLSITTREELTKLAF